MKIFEILKNPIVKIIAVVMILYFGLLDNKKSPESLGNRLSKESLQKDLAEIKKKGNFIISNISYAKSQLGEGSSLKKDIETRNLVLGKGEKINCGEMAIISYRIYDASGQQIAKKAEENFIFNANSDNILEKYLENMNIGGVKEVIIPKNYQTQDLQLQQYQEISRGNIKYQITLKNIDKSKPINCENNEKEE